MVTDWPISNELHVDLMKVSTPLMNCVFGSEVSCFIAFGEALLL